MIPISADSHVVESPAVFTGLAERFGDEAPRIKTTEHEVDAIMIPARGGRHIGAVKIGIAGVRLREDAVLQRRAGHKPSVDDFRDPSIQDLIAKGYQGLRAGLRDGARRHEDQDADGVAAEFLYPSFFGMFSFQNTELLIACQQNYNDWLGDYCSEAKGRLHGLAAIPVQDPEAGLAELERVIRRGFKGGCIPCAAPPERPYRDKAYEPIWSLAEEAGFPLSMHIGTNAYLPPELRHRPLPRDPIADYANAASTAQRTISELICQGVAQRHPRLKFVVSEFNAGWIAHWLDRLDQGHARNRRFASDPLELRPSEYWHRQFYATIEDDRPAILTRELIGVDNLMWGSDYPHLDSTFPCSREVLEEIMEGVPEDERRKITYENVRTLYGLDGA